MRFRSIADRDRRRAERSGGNLRRCRNPCRRRVARRAAEFTLRRAPRCSCLVQPFSVSRRAKNSIMKDANWIRSSSVMLFPACAFEKIEDAIRSEQGVAKQWSSPWSERRQPREWKSSWRLRRASRKLARSRMSRFAAADSCTIQVMNSGSPIASALSGRKAGNTRVARFDFAISL